MTAPVQPGEVIDGKYRVERVLGEGGMGIVVAATHLVLEERVALKFLLPHFAQRADFAARFVREARAAARIKNEHIARVSDVGHAPDGSPYMVMEYLDGTDLDAMLMSRGAFSIEETCDYVLQACAAIADAHRAGIVHRDLKPSNLFLTFRSDGNPCIKVLDFGISKMEEASGQQLTSAGHLGTPAFMSPEQLRSAAHVDLRTDIWALGGIIHQLLTTRYAFDLPSFGELCAAILHQPAPPLRSLRPDVPEGLEAAVLHCLEKDRDHRFANVAELANAIAPFATQIGRTAADRTIATTLGKSGAGTMALHARSTPTPSLPGSAPRPMADGLAQTGSAPAVELSASHAASSQGASAVPKKGSGAVIGLVLGGMIVAGAIVFFVTRPKDPPKQANPPETTTAATPPPPPPPAKTTPPPPPKATATTPDHPSPPSTGSAEKGDRDRDRHHRRNPGTPGTGFPSFGGKR